MGQWCQGSRQAELERHRSGVRIPQPETQKIHPESGTAARFRPRCDDDGAGPRVSQRPACCGEISIRRAAQDSNCDLGRGKTARRLQGTTLQHGERASLEQCRRATRRDQQARNCVQLNAPHRRLAIEKYFGTASLLTSPRAEQSIDEQRCDARLQLVIVGASQGHLSPRGLATGNQMNFLGLDTTRNLKCWESFIGGSTCISSAGLQMIRHRKIKSEMEQRWWRCPRRRRSCCEWR